MDEITQFDWLLAFVAVGGIILNITIVALSRRGQVAKTKADNADAYESLSATVNNLSAQVKALRLDLEIERKARLLAEAMLAALQTKFTALEAKYNALEDRYTASLFENEALKEALEEVINNDK